MISGTLVAFGCRAARRVVLACAAPVVLAACATVPEGVSEIRVGVCGFNKKDDEQVVLRELRMQPKPDKSQPTQFVRSSVQLSHRIRPS